MRSKGLTRAAEWDLKRTDFFAGVFLENTETKADAGKRVNKTAGAW
jgi:hypothetical protein